MERRDIKKLLILLAILLTLSSALLCLWYTGILLVLYINLSPAYTWRATYRSTVTWSIAGVHKTSEYMRFAYLRAQLSRLQFLQEPSNRSEVLESRTSHIPAQFDAREKWPHCPSLFHVPDQAGCGSCWAVTSALVISDRICIGSGGNWTSLVSAEDILSCALGVVPGQDPPNGCHGGSALQAFRYWLDQGVVSGGSYGSNDGCKPYSFPPTCGAPCHADEMLRGSKVRACASRCRPAYGKAYQDDKLFASEVYWLRLRRAFPTGPVEKSGRHREHWRQVRIVQREVLQRGPVALHLYISAPFQLYASGVINTLAYEEVVYAHVVRVVGWDETDAENPHWIITNTWGTDWGEKGWFRLSMTHPLGDVVAGMPA